MTQLDRMRIEWTGFPGAPGVTTLYFASALAARDAVQALMGNFLQNSPENVALKQADSGDRIESTTGALVGAWSGDVRTGLVGANVGAYAGPVGAQIQWTTDSIHNGRRVRGRTFLVPQMPVAFEANGTLTASAQAYYLASAQAFIAAQAGNFYVFSRPREATPSWTDVHGRVHPAQAAVAGAASVVTGARVPDLAVVLRSRRD